MGLNNGDKLGDFDRVMIGIELGSRDVEGDSLGACDGKAEVDGL